MEINRKPLAKALGESHEEISDSDIAKFQEELESLEFEPLRETAREKARKDMEEHKKKYSAQKSLSGKRRWEGKKVKDG